MSDAPLIFCRCALARAVPEERTSSVLEGLENAGIDVRTVADLCGLAARRDLLLKSLCEHAGATIIACQPRAVRWLFHLAGAELPGEAAVLNMREEDAEAIVDRLKERSNGRPGSTLPAEQEKPDDGWIPWFPVIDRERCSSCMQCKKFCLFNVFAETEEGSLEVKNPANCKTNCPACARICPERAIIFPKHETGLINGSDDIAEGEKEPSRVDLKKLLEGDLYKVLRERGPGAGGILEAARRKAEEERRQCACSAGEEPKPVTPPANIFRSLCGCECEKGKDDGTKEVDSGEQESGSCDGGSRVEPGRGDGSEGGKGGSCRG